MYHHPAHAAQFNGFGAAAPLTYNISAAGWAGIAKAYNDSKQCKSQGGEMVKGQCVAKATGIPTYVWIGLGVAAMGGAYYFLKVRKQ